MKAINDPQSVIACPGFLIDELPREMRKSPAIHLPFL
jgi:hypothetical protein